MFTGTSQAAPFVAGAIALMKAVHPSMTPVEARRLLVASADPAVRCGMPGAPEQSACGAGLLDLEAAVAAAQTAEGTCGDECMPRATGCSVADAGHAQPEPAAGGTLLLAVIFLATVIVGRRRV
jgi:hypothetical protein